MKEEKKIISVQVDLDMYNKLEKIANDDDRTITNLLRKILKEYLNKI